ncbi:hypothetical protein RF11_10786 [Thelohanellus kitauei]|uniref:Uncharacterized protein n=1 Tax=Thelohanellus kitauei TaxID=669202 RepID=A0A0C2MFY3_THEKT|nr:hypothetical protein RF11_02128 [Thelohanellus kitauei]KII68429.1 hypothetical protein RF11_10786 [Thelohanellus kitauei]
MDKHFPTWQMINQMTYDVILSAMSHDQLTVTHALSVRDENNPNIDLLFDHLSYDKVRKEHVPGCLTFFHVDEYPRRRSLFQMHTCFVDPHKGLLEEVCLFQRQFK